jgi:hypothetical protein
MFGVPLAPGPESVLFGRLTGIRDFVLGAYLWKRTGELEAARKQQGARLGLLKNQYGHNVNGEAVKGATTTANVGALGINGSGSAQAEGVAEEVALSNLRSALWLGLVCDLVDVVSVTASWIGGNPISVLGEVSIGGGAALFVAIAGQALWSMRRL